jgi:hypothetical protein
VTASRVILYGDHLGARSIEKVTELHYCEGLNDTFTHPKFLLQLRLEGGNRDICGTDQTVGITDTLSEATMRGLKAFLCGTMFLLPFTLLPKADAQVAIQFGAPPVCPFGYYDYSPYGCAPSGFYGPGYFYNGIFLGVGPWHNWGYSHGWGSYRFRGGGGGRYRPGGGYRGRPGGHYAGRPGGARPGVRPGGGARPGVRPGGGARPGGAGRPSGGARPGGGGGARPGGSGGRPSGGGKPR